jgi:CubicO group peptidase (beta-lactamase class C family)
MSATEAFVKGLQAATGNDLFPEKFWSSYPEKYTHSFQDALDKYAEYYLNLNSEQQEAISEILRDQIKTVNFSNEEAKSIHALVEKILDDANIPALSISWHQKNNNKNLALGITDTSSPKSVDTATLFQASSLSKPVSAAIILDLVAQGKFALNTPLADIGDYGPSELKKSDPHYYQELTIGMVIGQCSGLPNWFYSGDKIQFIARPGSEFNYSGVAFDFLKDIIEKKLQKNWETIAQEFFSKAGMQNSTFKQLPASHLHGKNDVARGHQADSKPILEKASIDSPEIPAASLLTTANDFMIFLQYCYGDESLRSTLLTGVYKLNKDFPDTPLAANQIQWGLGMAVYTDEKNMIAFHLGGNPGWSSFCAINMKTGDSVACFANSVNGPNVFQHLAEPIVGDMKLIFNWLSIYFGFTAKNLPNNPTSITAFLPILTALTDNVDLKRSLSPIKSSEHRGSKKQSFTSFFSHDDLTIQTTADEKREKEHSHSIDKKTTDDTNITYSHPRKK